ncbi:glycoside hydrolase family 16 protein [Rhodotorula toruloides]|uniref:Glycoside hydrolase family 16 protein n=1 Tax=Rhodotorula toruloides TaxID=5286 RepID=A0A511KP54_RHOTO|nr:glycoside hydrolase family 16 protein [Rhodotorula toruloides]
MTCHSRLDSSSSDGSDWSSSDDDDEPAPLPAQRSTGLGVWILLLLGVCAVMGTALLVVFLQRKDGAGTGQATQEAAAATNPVVLSINSPDKYDSPPIIDQGDGEGQDDLTTTPARIRHSTSTSSSKSKPTGSSSPSNSSSSSGTGNLPPLVGSQLLVDFSTFTSGDTPSFLTSHSLQISTDPIGSTPISHRFLASNVDIVDGAWRLKVTGQSGNGDIKSAEVSTKEQGILYGRVTTRAKASPVPGVCHCFFLYTNDNLEVDIELLSSYYTKGLGDSVKPGLQMTNQALTKGGKASNVVVPYPSDPTGGFHDVASLPLLPLAFAD